MATSGEIRTNTTYGSYFWVRWKQAGQDVAANKTTINWSCGVYCGHSFYTNAIKMSAFAINGVQVYGGGTYSNFAVGDHTLASGSMEIAHNADGTKTFSISSFTGWLYSGYNYSSNGGSYALAAIPRQATITSAPDFTHEDDPTITYSNPAGNAVTKLEACISLTGAKADVDYRSIPKTGTSYTFPLTAAERELLLKNTPGPSRSVQFFVRTTIGGNVFYSSLKKTFSVKESAATKPEVSMTLSPVSTLGEPFKGMYIQGKTKVKAALAITTKYGADVAAAKITVEGAVYPSPYESGVLSQSGTQTVKATVKDTRGFYGTYYKDIDVVAYSNPGISSTATCYRSDENGKKDGNSTSLWIRAKRVYSSVNGKNSCALQWRWKKATDAWNDSTHPWKDLLSQTDTATDLHDTLIPDVEFELKHAYTVQIKVVDTLGGENIRTFDVPTQDVALHLGPGGKTVSVGSYCDTSRDYTFHSEWDAIFDKNLSLAGALNGVYIQSLYLGEHTAFRVQTKFSDWGVTPTGRHAFLVFGSRNGSPVLGVCCVDVSGTYITWSGSDIVTISKEEKGVLAFEFGHAIWDVFTVLSPYPFTMMY